MTRHLNTRDYLNTVAACLTAIMLVNIVKYVEAERRERILIDLELEKIAAILRSNVDLSGENVVQ